MDNEKKTVIEKAKSNLKAMREAMTKTHDIGKMCMSFVAGEQWDSGEVAKREETNRPVITINRLSNPVNIVVNKNAMESARIKVAPFEDADVDTAKVINGLLRHIQFSDKSDAVDAYSWAFFCLAVAGFGYWRVDAEYLNEKEFDQELLISKVDDPFSVYLDPDGRFAIIAKFMRRDAFEEKYGEEGSAEFGDIDIEPEHEDDVLVVEYWERTETPVDLYRIEIPEPILDAGEDIDIDAAIEAQTNPQVQKTPGPRVLNLTKEELEETDELGNPLYPEYVILKKRKSQKIEIKQYIYSGEKELEVNDWPGKYIPIVGVFSRKFKLESGDYFYKPLIYDSIDPQRLYNFYRSQDAELMLQVPKAVWLGAEGQFEGHEEEFDNANKTLTSRLEYKNVDVDGKPAPMPQRIPPPQASEGYYRNMTAAAEEIKATTGIFDPSLGAPSNEISGKAIIARRQQGDTATYHYTLAINSGLRITGLILLDQIPYRYDAPRTIRILGEDMADEVVKINQKYVDGEGKTRLYDLTTGNYDVKIETGASSVTRRQDAAENLLEFARVVPSAGAVGADMIVSNLDAEKSDELALRMKAALAIQMPGLFQMVDQLQNGQGSVLGVQLMQARQQAQAMQQQIMKMAQAMQAQGKQMQDLQAKLQKNSIAEAQIDAQTEIQKTKIKTAGELQQEIIKGRFNHLSMPPGYAGPGGIRQ